MKLPVLDDVADAATHCSYCPKLCRYACPVAEATGRESATPWGIDREIATAARTGVVTEATAAAVYRCTGCRGCGSSCLPGLDLPTHVRAARAVVVTAGLQPEGVLDAAGIPRAPSAALASGATADAAMLVLPGCRSTDDDALAAVLAAVDLPYRVVDAPACCGAHTADVGLRDAAEQQADDLVARLVGAETVVVADPHCARRLRIDREDPRVVALPTLLAGLVDRLVPAEGIEPDAVTWHDPCWLGRGLATYDEPRAVVAAAAGAPVLESEHHRDHSGCTGGGMGYPQADPHGAAEVLRRRAEELAVAAPAGTEVVTACPTAAARLRAAGLPASDLAAYLVSRLSIPGST